MEQLEPTNPLLMQENYAAGYQESIANLKNNPNIIAFDKLCYELFEHQEAGRKFMELVDERYIRPALVQRGSTTYQIDVLWQEGFKDAFRLLAQHVQSHKQRIKAESA